jgi:pyrroline-5-carboxylate reductase
MKKPIIGFIGGGNMTQSLISGLIESGIDPKQIWVSDRNDSKLNYLSTQFGIHTDLKNQKIAQESEVLILAVKPQDMHVVADELKEFFTKNSLKEIPLFISIAPGIQTDVLERWLNFPAALVRAMPNTPALLRAGATGLYANSQVSDEQRNLAESLLRAVGITVWVNHEHDMDTVTALSGSGPAYFFLMMEALQQGAESLGLSNTMARLLTLQTALGAARMALESDINLEELRKKIASPGGTTERALNTLETGGIRDLFKKALISAKDRSLEISELLDKE